MSKILRTKQVYCFGKINSEDVNPQIHRIEKLNNVDLTTLPLRTWFYEGKTFESPQWTQSKKPFIINAEIRKEYNQPNQPINYKLIPASHKPKNKGLLRRILSALTTQSNQQSNYDQTANNINEDEKGDYLMLDDDDLMFSET